MRFTSRKQRVYRRKRAACHSPLFDYGALPLSATYVECSVPSPVPSPMPSPRVGFCPANDIAAHLTACLHLPETANLNLAKPKAARLPGHATARGQVQRLVRRPVRRTLPCRALPFTECSLLKRATCTRRGAGGRRSTHSPDAGAGSAKPPWRARQKRLLSDLRRNAPGELCFAPTCH